MKKVFINYRRSDSLDIVHRLAIEIADNFGKENVFFDQLSISPGTKWPDSIRKQADKADILLIIIGCRWLHTYEKESGRRRIDMRSDWVRQEILYFKNRQENNCKLVILPVLVKDASMPNVEYLDTELSFLCDHQAVALQNTGQTIDFTPVLQQLTRHGFNYIAPNSVTTPFVGDIPLELDQCEEQIFLNKYEYWKIVENDKLNTSGNIIRELYRLYEFSSYEKAWEFLVLADKLGIKPYSHHPRWQNTYNRVEFWLCTFNVGYKPSEKDIRLAEILEKIWVEFKNEMIKTK